ncbi:MAG: class I SAM-dependent methyltransferase [Bacteroidota bacterium]
MSNYLHTHYNLDDPKLVSILDETPYWSAPPGTAILDRMPFRKNMNVLDIGFGTGFPLIEAAMRLGNTCSVYGIDPWSAGCDRVKQKLAICGISNVKIIEGTAERMSFENNFFDIIVSNNGMNNIDDLPNALKECNRVAKTGGRFIFTFNTEKTFIEFYSVYREVLMENGLQEYDRKISEHIYHKRKPIPEMQNLLSQSGFKLLSSDEDAYYYSFTDGTAMLNHFLIRLAFLDTWKNILPEAKQDGVFKQIELKLNNQAALTGGFSMKVPFIMMDCEKIKAIA